MSDIVREAIISLADGNELNETEFTGALSSILRGECDDAKIAAFLMGLRMLGETDDHIAWGAGVLRANAKKVVAPEGVIDTCGTGGLGWTSLNTSTAAAIVAAAAGAKVAKHGNRSVPPKTGSADVLEALGVNLTLSEQQIQQCFDQAGLMFMFAPAHHGAMKHVGPVRKSMGIRTIFNFLGPLSNPAGAQNQVVGVFAKEWVEPFAKALKKLGAKSAWVVHGLAGLDEISTCGPTYVAQLKNDEISTFEINVDDYGIATASLDDLRGSTPDSNAQAIRNVLDNQPGPFADLVIVNAAASLLVAGHSVDLADGITKARDAIASGNAKQTLNALIEASNAN